MLIALIPNVAEGLDASVGLVAAAITAYMVPFAALQLVSGTVAERLGAAAGRPDGLRRLRRRRARVRARSGDLELHRRAGGHGSGQRLPQPDPARRPIGGRRARRARAKRGNVRGRPDRRDHVRTRARRRARGGVLAARLRASWQSSPRCWRCPARRSAPSTRIRADGSLRALLNRWISLLAAKAMLGYLGFTAIGFVLVLVAAEEFGLGLGTRGLLVAGYGVGGILLGRYAGRSSTVSAARRPRSGARLPALCGVLGLFFAPTVVEHRARLLCGRLRRGVRLGRPEHNRRRVLPGQSLGRDLRLQRVQIRGRRNRAAHLRAALPRRHAGAVPAGGRLLARRLRTRLAVVHRYPR